MVSCVLMVDFVVRHYHSPITVIVFAKYLVCNPTLDHIHSPHREQGAEERHSKKTYLRKYFPNEQLPKDVC